MTRKLLLTTLAIAGGAAAQAAVVFYEDFSGSNFVVGSTVNGVTSNTTGAAGQGENAWAFRSGAGASITGNVTSTALNYSSGAINITGSGKAVTANSTASGQTLIFGVNTELSTWGAEATPAEVGSGSSLYFSMLVQYNGAFQFDTTRMGFLTGTNGIAGTGATGLLLGTDNANPPRMGATSGSLNTIAFPGTPSNPTSGATYLLVGQVTSNGTQWADFNMWINPTTANGSETPYLAQTGLTGTGGITAFYFSAGSFDIGDSMSVGKLRVATTWAEAVVPEPSTYALLAGISTLGLALWRRR